MDYFVELKDGRIGKIEFFYGEKLMPKLLLQLYEKIHHNFHWTEVEPSQSYEIHLCESIEQRLLYLNTGSIKYITIEPNLYGFFGF